MAAAGRVLVGRLVALWWCSTAVFWGGWNGEMTGTGVVLLREGGSRYVSELSGEVIFGLNLGV
jgi:hypothetical protein